MLFVHDDQRQIFYRRKDRRARAYHNARILRAVCGATAPRARHAESAECRIATSSRKHLMQIRPPAAGVSPISGTSKIADRPAPAPPASPPDKPLSCPIRSRHAAADGKFLLCHRSLIVVSAAFCSALKIKSRCDGPRFFMLLTSEIRPAPPVSRPCRASPAFAASCVAHQARGSAPQTLCLPAAGESDDLLLIFVQLAAWFARKKLFEHRHLHRALRIADGRNVFARNPFLAQQEIQHLPGRARR